MRIGIDARFYGSLGKGLGRYTEKLLEQLEQIDQDNEYIVFLRQENFSEYQPKNSHFQKQIAQYNWYGFSEQIFFTILLYRGSFDIVHFPHFNVPLLYRKRFIVTIHDLILVHYPTIRNTTRFAFLYWIKFLAYRMVIASAVRRAYHIITVSHFTEQDIMEHYPAARGKITVTYEAADLFCQYATENQREALFAKLRLTIKEKTREDALPSRDIIQPYFLYVGNAYPHKNLPILFAAAREFPEYAFVMVGKEDYFYVRLKEQVEKAQLRNIIFSGFLTDQELSLLYRYARAYLFPSLYEGFGLPPLEAMARGTPVISSDRGSLPEILGDAACYFDPTDEKSLIRSLREVEYNEVRRNTLRTHGYHQVARYCFRDMAIATHALYVSSVK